MLPARHAASGTRGKKRRDDGEPGRELDLFELWQIAIVDLGLDAEFFWSLTLREFHALVLRHAREQYRLSAHVCAFLAECWRDPEKRSEPFTIGDFLPSVEEEEEQPQDPMLIPRTIQMLMSNSKDGREDLTQGVKIEYK